MDEPSILFVDDEADVLKALGRTAHFYKWRHELAKNAREGLEKLASGDFAVVVSDFRMPGMDGMEFLTQVRDRWPNIERILLTAHADADALERGINDAAIGRFLRKPWRRETLCGTIDQALAAGRMRREREVLLERIKNRNEELTYVNRLLEDSAAASERAAVGYRRLWDVALQAISDPLLIINPDMRVEVANRAAAEVSGAPVEELEGRKCHSVLFQSDVPCTGCPLGKGVGRVVRREGKRERTFDARAYPMPGNVPSHLCVYRDITRELAFQAEAVHVEKMAAIGRLSGGVAHELNNPLHGILSFVQLAQKPDVPPEKLVRYHEVIRECAIRCRDIVQSLRDFSRRSTAERHEIALVDVVDKALVLFHEIASRIQVRRREGAARAIANLNQLQQIVINLIQNAKDADPDGKMRIDVYVDGAEAVIAVDDGGPGVPKDERERIFEPFYTTKPQGQGTGLGLAISHTLTVEHGGALRVRDSDLGGARFELRLPLPQRGEA